METRQLGKCDNISLLGFGCMRLPRINEDTQDIDKAKATGMVDYALAHGVNYFDTAYPYHDGLSEPFIGEALSRHPRESFYLASKLPTWLITCEADVERYFNEQLARCRVDYFDYYLVHSLTAESYRTMEKHNVYALLKEKQRQGKLRRLGFSFHDTPELLEKIAGAYDWDFAQIQLNYMDWELQDAKRQYRILEDRHIPVIVMEPVRGGALASLCDESAALLKNASPRDSIASWAIRYAATLPNVLTVLSGMSDLEQVKDNIRTLTDFQPMREQEYRILEQVLAIYRKSAILPCTGCRYCMDCPAGVDIPGVFACYKDFQITGNKPKFDVDYLNLGRDKLADRCISCGQCVEHCPQGIRIPEMMEKIASFAAVR